METEEEQPDWGRLTHAYGPADDIPGLLRAMESADAGVREGAMDELVSALCHQGDVHDASAHAVPHLARLALDGPGHRPELLWLLGGIAGGAGTPAERTAARRATALALPSLLHLAHDPAAPVRDAVLLLITALGRPYALPLLPLLRARLDAEPDPAVRGRVVTALALLEAGDGGWRHGLLTDPEPRVRLAAAEDLLRTAGLPLPAGLVDVAARAYAADPHARDGAAWPHPHRPFTDRLLADPDAAVRAVAHGVPLAHEITERWRDREAEVLPWVLRDLRCAAWEVYRLARLTAALPPPCRAAVRERVRPWLAADGPELRAAVLTALARARAPEAVGETARLVLAEPAAYSTVRAVTAVADVYGAAALPVARAVAGRLDAASAPLVEVLTRYPEAAAAVVDPLAALVRRHVGARPAGPAAAEGRDFGPADEDTGAHAVAAVAVLGALGAAAAGTGERALSAAARGGGDGALRVRAAVAHHRVAGDPRLALSVLGREPADGSSWWLASAGRLGPAGAPLLPLVEPWLAPGTPKVTRGEAALAVRRITGRTEDTVEPLARWLAGAVTGRGWEAPMAALTEIGLLPRFAVPALRRAAGSARRVGSDPFAGDAPHPDYALRAAARRLLAAAAVLSEPPLSEG
ncbi:hypothetical protein [Streptomyces naphthomycinicus]|uniref:hypothetical protein n=1 Tax=Streptomyces naphthomycinicus TaxID=2872625 RepID=UPI001CED0E85|nr:hypothetical protein [Streptomyces sp. TML10]